MRLIDADERKQQVESPYTEYPIMIQIRKALKDFIDDAQTIDPVKHGKWEPFDLTWGRSVYACTVCGEAIEVPTENGKPIFDYCPNCGAKMDGGEE